MQLVVSPGGAAAAGGVPTPKQLTAVCPAMLLPAGEACDGCIAAFREVRLPSQRLQLMALKCSPVTADNSVHVTACCFRA